MPSSRSPFRHPLGSRGSSPLVAVLWLTAAAAPTTAALAQAPDPGPLWKAYPLTPGEATGAKPAERPNGEPLVLDGDKRIADQPVGRGR